MLITQSHISKSLSGLDFKGCYNLSDYTNPNEPSLFFGMYDEQDKELLANHTSHAIVIWQGMDSLTAEELTFSDNTRHIAISPQISAVLTKANILHKLIPITATRPVMCPEPKGDNIYYYSSDNSPSSLAIYGYDTLRLVAEKVKIPIIHATLDRFSKEELYRVYQSSFINLRLTTHDGCPNTNLEMGLMGRRSVFNGNIPGSIPWNNASDILQAIEREYAIRKEPPTIHQDVYNFLNIGDSWRII